MSSVIEYKKDIFPRFLIKARAYDLFDENNDCRYELLCSWVHSAITEPYVARLFSQIKLKDDEENKDGTIEYELKRTTIEDIDREFVLEILGIGMLYMWVDWHVNDLANIMQLIATSDEKFYAQATHLTELENLRDSIMNRWRGYIRDRGYANNSYLDGTSVSSRLRSTSE